MSHRIVTFAALAIIGSSAFGLEALAVSRMARGASDWIETPEVQAVGRASRIAAQSLGHRAAEEAKEIAMGATLGVVRGLSAIYRATGGHANLLPGLSHARELRVIRVLKSGAADAGFDFGAEPDADAPCCPQKKAARVTS